MSTNHVTKLAVFIFILVAGFILRTMYEAGEFKTLEPHYSGECLSVAGVAGAEDITFLKNGTALISSDNRRSRMDGSLAQGTIYQYRPKAKDHKLVNLRPELDTGFHPHGISVYEDPDGKIFLQWLTITRAACLTLRKDTLSNFFVMRLILCFILDRFLDR